MIDRDFLQSQLKDLSKDLNAAHQKVGWVNGAADMCRFLLAKMDEEASLQEATDENE